MKKKFDMLNDTKNDLEKLDSKIDGEMSEEEKAELRKRVMGKLSKERVEERSKKNKNKKVAVAAALACTVIGGVSLTNEEVIAGVTNLGKNIEEFFYGSKSDLTGFKSEINKVSTDKGITVSIKEGFIDNNEIKISGSIDYSQYNYEKLGVKDVSEMNAFPMINLEDIEVYSSNGKRLEVHSNGSVYEYEEAENGIINFMEVIQVKGELDAQEYKINLPFRESMIEYCDKNFVDKEKYIDGDWGVSFEVDNIEMKENTKVIDISKEYKGSYLDEKFSYIIDSFVINPASYTMHYRLAKEGEEPMSNSFNMIQVGENSYTAEEFGFEFYDENNEKLDFIADNGIDLGLAMKMVSEKEITKLKVVPVMFNPYTPDGNGEVTKVFKENIFEIDLIN